MASEDSNEFLFSILEWRLLSDLDGIIVVGKLGHILSVGSLFRDWGSMG
jgi:hypothetical protein